MMHSENFMASFFNIINLGLEVSEDLPLKRGSGWIVSVFLVTKGKLLITEWNPAFHCPRQIRVDQNCVYCTRHNMHRTLEAEDETIGYIIQFELSALYLKGWEENCSYQAAFYRLLDHPTVSSIDSVEMHRIQAVSSLLAEEAGGQNDHRQQVISYLLELLFILIIRQSQRAWEYDSPVNMLLHKFNRLLEQHYKTDKRVANYARQLFVTATHLNNIVKRNTGHTVSYHIQKRITIEALRQAQFAGTSCKEVAVMLGFANAAHFSKFFKKMTGETFSNLRRLKNATIRAA